MMLQKICSSILMLVIVSGIAGCGGGTVKSEQSNYSTTLGQELKDLEDAHNKGIIDDKQYNDAKAKLIEQRTRNK